MIAGDEPSVVSPEVGAAVAAAEAKPAVVTSANKKEVLDPLKACKVEGCLKPHHAKGFCSGHYKVRLKAQADLSQPKAAPAPKAKKEPKPKAAPKPKVKPADDGPHVLSVYFPNLALRKAVIADAKKLGISSGRRILMAVAKSFGVTIDE